MNDVRKDIRSQSLDLLRFPLALFVTAVHVFVVPAYVPDDVISNDGLFSSFPLANTVLRFVSAFITDQSVPVYYFIAGYVFFLGLDFSFDSYTGKLKRRCHSLLIPYLAWNTVAILFFLKMYLPGIRDISDSFGSVETDFSFKAFLNCFWDDRQSIAPYDIGFTDGIYPLDKPLWFVRDLMIMALITPVIDYIYRLPSRISATILAISTIVWAVRIPGLGHGAQLLEAFTFFAWGGFMSYHKRDMMLEFNSFRSISFILYPLLATTIFFLSPQYPQAMVYVKSLNIIVGLFFFYNIAALLITRGICRPSRFLAASSFFIYCGHAIIISPIGRRLYSIIPPGSDISMLIYLFALYFSVVGCLLIIFALMRRFTPRFLKLFNGGRI